MGSVGSVLKDRYEIIAELGKGGMSTVYLARDTNLGSYWAVKQVKNDGSVGVTAFKKEVELLSTLSHSDVPRIVDRIEIGDDFFVCMDFIDGTPLSKKLASEGAQSEKDVVEWARLLCDVLHYLHTVKANPIVYRDMKPDNIMLTKSGRVKLIDFGIAKECIRGKIPDGKKVGTPGYAAPEQYKGEPLDERTDIYALGITLHHMVTGRAPSGKSMPVSAGRNTGKTTGTTGTLAGMVQPIRQINPLLSEGLEYIINKCVQPDPKNRYQSCMELKRDLDNIETLNSKYRKVMQKKLFRFLASVLCFIISLSFMFAGNKGMSQIRVANYQEALTEGRRLESLQDYLEAEKIYITAISIDPGSVEAYIKLFSVLLPKNTDYGPEHTLKTKDAIDSLRRYVDNKQSPVYNNPELLYQMIKQCANLNDPAYAGYIYNYVEVLKDSKEYKEGILSSKKIEIDSYGIIAFNMSKDLAEQDFTQLSTALEELENYIANTSNITVNNKLENYYTLIKMYNTYPGNLQNAHEKIGTLGDAVKTLVENNGDSEELQFNSIIQLYETVVLSYYSSGMGATDIADKRAALEKAIQWFEYLEVQSGNLSDSVLLKKGNAYKGIFDTYNIPGQGSDLPGEALESLNKAEAVYQAILSKNNSSFLAVVNLADIYLTLENMKSLEERDYSKVISQYNKAVGLKDSLSNLSVFDLAQFSALRQKMQLAGIGE